MKRYRGNDWVKPGFYWNPAGWQIVTVERDGGYLPGETALRYIRLPILVVVPLGLVLGAFYVIFLPLAGFVMLFGFAGKKCFAAARKGLAIVIRWAWPLHNENG